MLQIGDIRIYMINESHIMVDPGGAFGLVPRVLWAPLLAPDANHLVPMIHNNLVVQTGGKNILVDAGHGTKMTDKQKGFIQLTNPRGTMTECLARIGLTPADIHIVINTHLHADHSGGNTSYDESGKPVATFPNATYYVQRREYEDAMRPNERTRATYMPMNYQPLYESGQMQLLDGDTEIVSGITGHVTPGHTPGHMSIRFENKGQQGLFVCDMASYAIHFERLGWMTGYDVEPLITLETKRHWQKWALDTNATLIFAHDSQRPVGHYVMGADGKASVVPVDNVEFV